ncbi:MAG: SUMF1/EgtB/PvdO family nonheme iron enzyme, partial [Candidatus Schekmanbacteria bacterium]|nr:SUMF1/EgtB/PvdO family nonheme iron enzyme [Candidatus Schekmanbacteria bacterium]
GVIVKLAGGETELAAALEAGRTAGFPAAWRAVGVRQGRRIFASSPRGELDRVWKLDLDPGADAEAAARRLSGSGLAEWAEADGWMRIADSSSELQVSGFELRAPSQELSQPETRNPKLATRNSPNDPDYGTQWGLEKIASPAAWDAETGDSSVWIAVVDTGVDLDHPDLADQIVQVANADLVNGDSDPSDDNGHGTHVAGIAAAAANNVEGGAGVCWGCRILPIKALDSSGYGSFSTIATAIQLAADSGARVINLSLGSTSSSQAVATAVGYARESGAVLIGAAGNNGATTTFYPAGYEGVLAVAATDEADARWTWSNYGDWVDLAAPGKAIWSTLFDNTYASWNGTSMAAPFVSGVAGLLLSRNPSWSEGLVREQLRRTTDVLGDTSLGTGRLNAARTLTVTPVPEVSVVSVTVDDSSGGDGDGEADPGETVTLEVTLRNGYGDVSAVTGTLAESSADVTVTDGAGSFGTLAATVEMTNGSDPFAIAVSGTGGVTASFTLALSGEGSWSDSLGFDLVLGGGEALPAVIATDRTLQSGRTYEVVGNTLVMSGATLTIESGVTLRFERDSTGFPWSLEVQGGLVANGTEEAPIVIEAPVGTSNMVLVPAGEFVMGCEGTQGSSTCEGDEAPVHAVYLDAYFIDKYEVTAAQYQSCVDAGACTATALHEYPCTYGDPGMEDRPINCVDWDQATAFCATILKRLPTEAEWEKAARGTDQRIFPWGNPDPDCTRVSYFYCTAGLMPVGSYPTGVSPYGAYDMAGNVLEWVSDWYGDDYYAQSSYQDPAGPASGSQRVIRGGSWGSTAAYIRAADRGAYYPTNWTNPSLGFRCAWSP